MLSKKNISLCLLWLLVPVTLFGTDIKSIGVPYVRNYAKDAYLAGNQNWAVTKDEHGVMYFGNSEGLMAFDGQYWNLYRLPNKPIVRSVAADGKGRIYVGAYAEIGYWANNKNGLLTYTSLTNLIPNRASFNDEVWKIYVDGKRVVFQSFKNIFIYENGRITTIKFNGAYLFVLKAGSRYFVGKADGSLLQELKGRTLETVPGSQNIGQVLTMLPMTDNSFLIGTAKNGVFKYDGRSVTRWKTGEDLLKSSQINNGVKISDKYFAFGTILNGIIILDTAGNLVQHLNKQTGLQNNTVLSLYLDNDENLWAGLDNGIDCIQINSPLHFYFDKEGTFGTVYSSIIHQNKIYLGTNQGLYYSDWRTDSGPFRPFQFKLIPGLQGQVWDLSLIDGQLICGHNDGTFSVNGNEITKQSNITGGWTIKKLNNSSLIQGNYTGLAIYYKDNGGKWRFDHQIAGFSEPARYVEPGGKNTLWVSHAYKGIYKVTLSPDMLRATEVKYYDQKAGLPSSYNINVFNLNDKIVFSSDKGFYYYDDITDRFYPYTQLNRSLGSFSVSNKIIAGYGKKYWFIDHGRAAIADLSSSGKLILNTGFLSMLNGKMVQYYENISRISNNNYLISTDDGFAIFNDAAISNKRPVKLPAVLVRHVESISDNKDVLLEHNGILNIPHKDNSIRIYYSLPYYNQSNITYQYYLEEHSHRWSEWSADNEAEFTNLPAGDYILKIRARINDDITSSTTSFKIHVQKPWYSDNLAVACYVILLIAGYYGVRYYYRLKLKRHQEYVLRKAQLAHDEQLRQESIAREQEIIKIKNDQLQHDLERKSRELTNSTMNIVYKNELLQKISTEMRGIKDSSGQKLSGDQLRRIQKVIEDAMTDEHDWNLFEDSFNETHENFFKKLKAQYPDLVPNDLKLCAYLRMNMNSKELASLLNITLRGVEIRRYRLRKKLKLEHDQNLTEFLINL